MSDQLLNVDKPYGVTEEGKLVDPQHPLCRQIIAHFTGQETPAVLLKRAGLTETTRDGKLAFKARPYDDVEIPDAYLPKALRSTVEATPAPAAAPTTVDIEALVNARLAEILPGAVAQAVAAQAQIAAATPAPAADPKADKKNEKPAESATSGTAANATSANSGSNTPAN